MKTRRPNLTAARAMVDRAYHKPCGETCDPIADYEATNAGLPLVDYRVSDQRPCGIQIAVAMLVLYGGSLLVGLLLCAVVLDRAKAWGLIH